MWTEILGENIGATHVDGYHVLFPIGDVTEDEVREAAQLLERRAAHEQVREQTRHLAEQVENQSRMNERLEEAGFDPLPSYSELRRGNVE